jgi:hypothetical protein
MVKVIDGAETDTDYSELVLQGAVKDLQRSSCRVNCCCYLLVVHSSMHILVPVLCRGLFAAGR